MKILIAVDSSEYSLKVRDFLATHGGWFSRSNQYTVLTVVPAIPFPTPAMAGQERLDQWSHEEAERALAPLRALFVEDGIEAHFQWLNGSPPQLIADFATKHGFDLIIMGSHGDGALKNLALGSVTTKVLALCRVPALILR